MTTPDTTVSTGPYLGPCPLQPVSLPSTHVPASGLVVVDVGTHQRFHPIRVLPLDNPQAAIFAGGDLYVSYAPAGPESGFRVERIDPKTGVLARSQWFLGYSSPPVAAFGSIWVVAGTGCPYQIIRLSQETLAVTMRTPLPQNLDPFYMTASDGALWLASDVSASLGRLDPHTGRISTVGLPEAAANSHILGTASQPGSDFIYVSVVNQDVHVPGVIDRFNPTTGSFLSVPMPRFELTGVLGVAGGVLWVLENPVLPDITTSFVAFSAASLTPLSCRKAQPGALAGISGTVDASVEDGILAFEQAGKPVGSHYGYWDLDCIAGRRPSTVARLQLPSDYEAVNSVVFPTTLLALGDRYLATLARVGNDGGSGVAIFPLDPRCAP
jgi:hypothetical protein